MCPERLSPWDVQLRAAQPSSCSAPPQVPQSLRRFAILWLVLRCFQRVWLILVGNGHSSEGKVSTGDMMATGFAGILSWWKQWFPHAQTSHGKAKPGWRQGCVSGCFEGGMWDRVFLHVPPDPILPVPGDRGLVSCSLLVGPSASCSCRDLCTYGMQPKRGNCLRLWPELGSTRDTSCRGSMAAVKSHPIPRYSGTCWGVWHPNPLSPQCVGSTPGWQCSAELWCHKDPTKAP